MPFCLHVFALCIYLWKVSIVEVAIILHIFSLFATSLLLLFITCTLLAYNAHPGCLQMLTPTNLDQALAQW